MIKLRSISGTDTWVNPNHIITVDKVRYKGDPYYSVELTNKKTIMVEECQNLLELLSLSLEY